MRLRPMGRAKLWPWIILSSLSSAWLLLYLILTKIIGPLNPDEVQFGHILWLTLQGKRQFIEFYSFHFPTYFLLYAAVLPHGTADSLSFIWAVRLSNVAVCAAYVAILFAVARRSALFLLPLLLFMLSVSRMVEVRPDTLGLLALNAAWGCLLLGRSRLSLAVAAMLAILGGACSARGLVMGVGFGAALIWLAVADRQWRVLLAPLAVLTLSGLLLAGAYFADPNYIRLMLKSVLIDPGEVLPRLTIDQRIVAVDRLPQVLAAAASTVLGIVCVARGQEPHRSGVIAIAGLSQLLLILLDPSPFPYVYGWSMIPCLAGLLLAGRVLEFEERKWIAAAGTLCAALTAVATLSYPLITGHTAPTGSNYRLWPDRQLDSKAIGRMPTADLVALEISRARQQSLSNQLLVRGELCRRIAGPVLATWQNHPICLPDAAYAWWSVMWPNVREGASGGEQWFKAIFRRHPPKLFIWDPGIPGVSLTLSPWANDLLKGYRMEAGFALRGDVTPVATDSSGRESSPLNSGRR